MRHGRALTASNQVTDDSRWLDDIVVDDYEPGRSNMAEVRSRAEI